MALTLATKYRPQKLEDVVEQSSVVKILEQQLKTGNIKNCYLFCGASGCGKTTCARIFANGVNKGKGYPIEIDAASNNGVDDVRAIVEGSNTKSLTSEYKVYIVDECHSLSNQGWQVLLKPLEEPNSKTIFIFCTTEVQKVPQTILNRVQRFDFSKISYQKIFNRLAYICEQENFTYEVEALKHITKISEGRMRDAITALEKVTSLNTNITLEETIKILGTVNYTLMFNLINNIIDKKESEALQTIDILNQNGKDFKLFVNEFTSFILDINKYLILKDFNSINIPSLFEKELIYATNFETSKKFYLYVLNELVKLKEQTRYETDIKVALEIEVIFLCK